MSIVTGMGDDGYSVLFGGERVPKHHPRLEAYGFVDEALSAIGMVRTSGDIPGEIDALLLRLQKELFVVASDLATPDPETSVPRVTSTMIRALETECDKIEKKLPLLKNFVIPSGTPAAATLFWARSVVRHAERRVAKLLDENQDVSSILVYLNRLGDLLFLTARTLNSEAGLDEDTWTVEK